uniref:Group II intron maturase-specific domain-containing protein n=1 Tax=uncultured Desulfobacterium sp. TaxID=201089 RepID=E1YE64_9BACT|nr:hypothetical protein N47_B19690 [uncultured Desulfobacterium sp.]
MLCRKSSEPAMIILRRVLERMGVRLNESKTRVVNTYHGMFAFLGFEIRMAKSRRTGNHYPHVQPSKKSLKAIKDRITGLTARTRAIMPLDLLVNKVNTAVRGWVGYFHVRNCSTVLSEVRWHLEERLRTHLRKRHKIRDRETGYVRFTNRDLYEKYGLYKANDSGLDKSACFAVKNIGKPCAGKPHARIDEGGMVEAVMVGILRHRHTKGAETDRPNLKSHRPSLYSTFYVQITVFRAKTNMTFSIIIVCPLNGHRAQHSEQFLVPVIDKLILMPLPAGNGFTPVTSAICVYEYSKYAAANAVH